MFAIPVVIPTYNRAHLINRAIKSVQNQSLSEWQLVIVDDGSTDNTEAVIQPFLSDVRIKYLKKKNSGAAESRNVGVDNATHDIITFLDSDDEAHPSWLQQIRNGFLNSENVGVVCCGFEKFNSAGVLISTEMPYNMGPLFENMEGRFTNGGVFALKRNIFAAVGGFDPQLRSGQHTELAIRLIPYLKKHNISINIVYEPLIKVHIHEGPRIRYNLDAIFLGTQYMVKKHEPIFERDKKTFIRYMSIIGVSAIRTKRYSEAKNSFKKALARDPLNIKSWVRFLMSNIPVVRDAIW